MGWSTEPPFKTLKTSGIRSFRRTNRDLANAKTLLVGTKSDLRGQTDAREKANQEDITEQEAIEMAKTIKAVCYLETSAKTGDGVKKVFDEAIRAALKTEENGTPCCFPKKLLCF